MIGARLKVWASLGVVIVGLFLFQRWQLSSAREKNVKLTEALTEKRKELEILVESSNQNYRLLETREKERNKLDELRREKNSKKLDKTGSEWGDVSLPASIINRLHD